MNENCSHKNTQIWEPHLAGARKCKDCGWVKNPNRVYSGKDVWFDEELELNIQEFDKYRQLKKKYET